MSSTRLSIVFAVAMACPPLASAAAETSAQKPIELAQAPPLSDAEKAKIEQRKREQHKGPPAGTPTGRQDGRSGPPQQQRQAPPPPPPPRVTPPPPPRVTPPPRVAPPPPPPKFVPPAKTTVPPPPPKFVPPSKTLPPPAPTEQRSGPTNRGPATIQGTPPPDKRFGRPPGGPETPRVDRGTTTPPPDGLRRRDGDRSPPVQVPPVQGTPGKGLPTVPPVTTTPSPKSLPSLPKAVDKGTQRTPPPAFLPSALPKRTPPTATTQAPQAPALRFDAVKSGRQQRVEDGGKRTVIREPGAGNRVIVKQNSRTFIHHDETARFKRLHSDAQTRRRPDGFTETFYVRGDGVRVVTVTDRNGRVVQRYRRDRSGREFNIIDNRRFFRNAAIGVGALGLAIALNLPPPRAVARERYIVDYDRASDDELYEVLSAPPIERLDRAYSLEEVRYSYELRQRMPRIDLDTINFEFGSWAVGPEQYGKLERMARAMLRMLERNPSEVFLIGAHTDAIGSEEDNLSLSDRRAETVAQILSEEFGVPAENLVTQGYGEQHLKVNTQEAEPRNRRVEVQRITPLMSEQQQR